MKLFYNQVYSNLDWNDIDGFHEEATEANPIETNVFLPESDTSEFQLAKVFN